MALRGRGLLQTWGAVLLLLLLLVGFSPTAFADSAETEITVSQTFDLSATDRTDVDTEVVYVLASLNPSYPMPAGSVTEDGIDVFAFTLTGNGATTIRLAYDHAGEYLYGIGVATDPANHYVYDDMIYSVQVLVRNTADGGLAPEVYVVRADGNKAPAIAFEHRYVPDPTNPVLMPDPAVKKTVTGSPSTASTFIFRLTGLKADNPMPAGSTGKDSSGRPYKEIQIAGSGEGEFGTWSYTAAGVYEYRIEEINTNAAGYTYDNTVYTIRDVVTDQDGQLVLNRTITNPKGNRVAQAEFTNKYSAGGGGKGPKTGEETPLMMLLIVFIVAVTVSCVVILIMRRKRKQLAEADAAAMEERREV